LTIQISTEVTSLTTKSYQALGFIELPSRISTNGIFEPMKKRFMAILLVVWKLRRVVDNKYIFATAQSR